MPGRTYQHAALSSYRFGFNGVEKDNEIKGIGNSLDFKFRMYDSRLGKLLSIDPLAKQYPWNSTYAFAENRVIDGRDLEGGEYQGMTSRPPVTRPTLQRGTTPVPSGGTARNPHQPYGPGVTAPTYINDNTGAGSAGATVRLIMGWFSETKPTPETTLKQRLEAHSK